MIGDSWRVGLRRAGHADQDERGGLGFYAEGVPGSPAAPGRQGSGRPQIPGSAALLHRSQHHLAGVAHRVRCLEHGLETPFSARMALISVGVQALPDGSVKWVPLSVSTVWIL